MHRNKEGGDRSCSMCAEIRRNEIFDVCRTKEGDKICNMSVELRRGIRFVTCV